jgi:hypothetical protein
MARIGKDEQTCYGALPVFLPGPANCNRSQGLGPNFIGQHDSAAYLQLSYEDAGKLIELV